MQAVVLAAGDGTRMGPLTSGNIKSLLPTAGKPIIEHILGALKEAGIAEAVIIYKDEAIKALGKEFEGMKLSYVKQTSPQGTGQAVKITEKKVKGAFLVTNGDNIVPAKDIKKAINAFRQKNGHVLSVRKEEDVSNLSSVVFDDNKKVSEIVEKPSRPTSLYASLGVYVFKQSIFEHLGKIKPTSRGELELPDAIMLAIKNHEDVFACELEEWEDASYPWDLLRINCKLLERIKREVRGVVEKGATIKGKVHVGKGTLVRTGAYIDGPVFIGEDCDIGPNCYIRAGTFVGNNCKIGNAVEIKSSIIMDNTNVGHLSYLGDSILGQDVNLGAGSISANLRLDDKNVKAVIKGKELDTGRRKLGVIIGNDVKCGINTSFLPGAVVGSHSRIGADTSIQDSLPDKTLIYSQVKHVQKDRK